MQNKVINTIIEVANQQVAVEHKIDIYKML